MTPKRRALVMSIFRAALEKPAGERVAFLDEACGGDESLHRSVERLLAGEAAPSLQSPLPDLLETGTLDFGPGETLAQYKVEAKIGEGGMGVVYWGYDTRLQRKVALKVLAPERFEDLNRKSRLMREARAASGLNHPNIVTIYEIGSDRDVDFIAMEYVEGKRLDELIPPRGLRPSQLLRYAVQVADALAKAHGAAVLHRDLKPSNIMVTSEGTRQASGLRPGQGVGTGGLSTRRSDSHGPATDRGRSGGWHGRLYVARAGGRPQARCPVRHLQLWLSSVRDGDWPETVYR